MNSMDSMYSMDSMDSMDSTETMDLTDLDVIYFMTFYNKKLKSNFNTAIFAKWLRQFSKKSVYSLFSILNFKLKQPKTTFTHHDCICTDTESLLFPKCFKPPTIRLTNAKAKKANLFEGIKIKKSVGEFEVPFVKTENCEIDKNDFESTRDGTSLTKYEIWNSFGGYPSRFHFLFVKYCKKHRNVLRNIVPSFLRNNDRNISCSTKITPKEILENYFAFNSSSISTTCDFVEDFFNIPYDKSIKVHDVNELPNEGYLQLRYTLPVFILDKVDDVIKCCDKSGYFIKTPFKSQILNHVSFNFTILTVIFKDKFLVLDILRVEENGKISSLCHVKHSVRMSLITKFLVYDVFESAQLEETPRSVENTYYELFLNKFHFDLHFNGVICRTDDEIFELKFDKNVVLRYMENERHSFIQDDVLLCNSDAILLPMNSFRFSKIFATHQNWKKQTMTFYIFSRFRYTKYVQIKNVLPKITSTHKLLVTYNRKGKIVIGKQKLFLCKVYFNKFENNFIDEIVRCKEVKHKSFVFSE